jgi:hypothetical protein
MVPFACARKIANLAQNRARGGFWAVNPAANAASLALMRDAAVIAARNFTIFSL